jgi:hypothetical protein
MDGYLFYLQPANLLLGRIRDSELTMLGPIPRPRENPNSPQAGACVGA